MKYSHLIVVVPLCFMVSNLSVAQDENDWASNAPTEFKPEIHHPNIAEITLFAQNPDIVTPVGIAVAPDGRVFVQENHTHKRNSDYNGPKTDRILVFEDTNNDGISDKRSVFYEGHTFSTDLLFGPDGHLYVSTRWFVGRFPNAASMSKAQGGPEKLVICETDGDYPHNGVGGLAIDPARPEWLAFGFGENLGADYTFVGSDGIKFSGGAEGGSTYLCRTDGTQLTRQSTGHWNAFGMAYDLAGNLFSTDNDPNATPPNRLLHVVPGADFGYEYRYGRSGRHPLVCWYGENPGTLGMIGALGEAACGVISHGPGQLISASWTDNRIDLHELKPKGASFFATREQLVSGPDDFRPVHFSYSADGRYLYFTDWVKLSYPVHGHGRVWRIEFKEPIQLTPEPRRKPKGSMSPEQALGRLGDEDPYARTEAVRVLSTNPDVLSTFDWQNDTNPVARAHYAVALKRAGAKDNAGIIPALLADKNQRVRFVGIKWIADDRLRQYQAELGDLLNRSDLSRNDLRAVMAAMARVSGESKKEFSRSEKLLELALDEERPAYLRALALKDVDTDHKKLTVRVLSELADAPEHSIRREAIRSLALHPSPSKMPVLVKLANDQSLNATLRADAIAGLAGASTEQAKRIEKLANDSNDTVSGEATRTLVSVGLATRSLDPKPPIDDIPSWETLLDEVPGKADVSVGRRLFFHDKLAGCYKCHAMDGRGNAVGPDLTTIHNQTDISIQWLLKHIVNPNAEMAPYYRPQQLLTIEGQVLTGLVIGKEGKKQAYVASDGELFFVDKDDVEARRELTTSIMPKGLLDTLTASEIRDLLAYLLAGAK